MGPFSEGLRPSRVVVDLHRIQHNFRTLRGLVDPSAFFCPMVKANAYGHGDVAVAKALREIDCKHLGVALIEEGLHLRRGGDRGRILVFGVFLDALGAEAMIDYELSPVIGEWEQVAALETALARRSPDAPMRLHIEFNTGMNRLGFPIEDAPKLRDWLSRQTSLKLEGICTHLLHGEDGGVENGRTAKQLAQFTQALEAFRGLRFHAHALNSSGATALWHRARGTSTEFGPLGARPGIALYGIQPSQEASLKLDLKPALSWTSRIIRVNHVAKGESVSYDGRWIAEKDSVIGVIPLGYADGFVRALSGKGSVLCRGRLAPVTGTVCMDYFMVDLTQIAQETGRAFQVNEEVVLIGDQAAAGVGGAITAQDVADLTGTIPYEVCTRISERVPRHYHGGKATR